MMIYWDVNDHDTFKRGISMEIIRDNKLTIDCRICGYTSSTSHTLEHYDTCPFAILTRRLEEAINTAV